MLWFLFFENTNYSQDQNSLWRCLPLTIYTLEIRSNSQRGLSVPDASLVQVSSTNDVIELMNLGHKNRAVGATALNDRSSRSHRCVS